MFCNDIGTYIDVIALQQAEIGNLIQKRRRINYGNVYFPPNFLIGLGLALFIVILISIGSLDTQQVNFPYRIQNIMGIQFHIIIHSLIPLLYGFGVVGMQITEIVFGLLLKVDVLTYVLETKLGIVQLLFPFTLLTPYCLFQP